MAGFKKVANILNWRRFGHQYPDGGKRMKRLMLFAAGLTFLLCAWAFAAEQAAVLAPAKAAPAKTAIVKVTKMRAPGTILEITDSTLKIERKVKDSVETMEFVLDKPLKFKVGDKVRVSYIEKNGKMIVTRIVRTADVRVKKPVKPGKENKPAVGSAVSAAAPPAAK
jgi:hypothetical protein